MPSLDLWRVEAACRAAWPAAEERRCGGWLLRRSGGTTRRTNSLNPLETLSAASEAQAGDANRARAGTGADAYGIDEAISAAQAFYDADATLPVPLFRLPSFLPELVLAVERRDFVARTRTVTLHAALEGRARSPDLPADARFELAGRPGDRWLAARQRLSQAEDAQQRAFETMLETIEFPTRFATSCERGAVAAVAYGVLCRELLVIEAVATDPSFRRRGHARRAVAALLCWARDRGVRDACLQVVADNTAARALYRGLGFDEALYSYAYYELPRSGRAPRPRRAAGA